MTLIKRYVIRPGDWTNDRTAWLNCLLHQAETGFKPAPPPYWVRQQLEKGRSESSAYAIWHRSYNAGRKYVIWDQAPDEDWRERGYLLS